MLIQEEIGQLLTNNYVSEVDEDVQLLMLALRIHDDLNQLDMLLSLL